jgi:hydrogenase nickel incorporation protein HypA/HybF
MHELSVTEQLLNITLEHARKANAQRVLKIHVAIGDLTGFVGESIQFYLEVLSKGTPAENASLSITHVPARARCKQCQSEFTLRDTNWVCPQCGGLMDDILSGREFHVESIEVE